MKSTGIVRPIDKLGRVVLPKELRRSLNLNNFDTVEIFTDEDYVLMRKYETGCIYCKEMRDLVEFRNKKVCKKCLDEMRGLKR